MLSFPPDIITRAREIFAALMDARTVLVTSEPSPDGDAMGAELALDLIARHAFARAEARDAAGDVAGVSPEKADRRVLLVNEQGCPKRYRFLAGSEKVRHLDTVTERDFDLAIVVDGGVERAGATKALFDRAKKRVYIDHHKFGSRESYDISLSAPRASSTTQVLFAFFADPEIGVPLTREAAEAIYLGLIYDTGSFQYSLTQPLTHEIAARLMETGFDFARVHERALLTQELEGLVLTGRVLASASRNTARDVIWAAAGIDFVAETGLSGDDCNKIIQTLCFVEGVEAAILFRELERDVWKLSLRSRGKVDVASLAREMDPQGGGHDRAAGCTLLGNIGDVSARTVKAIEGKLGRSR